MSAYVIISNITTTLSDGPGPFLVRIEYLEAAMVKGKHLVRNTYLDPKRAAGIMEK